jgi:heme/copper-type cytochrome/quinol oxidase subunit 2
VDMKRVLKHLFVIAGAILSLALTSSTAFAQCAMCRAAAVASGKEASLNLAILVLLIPPVLMFCAIFIVAYRFRAAQGETPKEDRTNRAIPPGLYPPIRHGPFSK